MKHWIAAVLAMTTPALADDLPRGLGHPTDGSHWYDRTCCDQRDCEEVEPGAITRTDAGLMVKYRSSRGHVAEGLLFWSGTGIKPSRDGKEHACSYNNGKVICAYIPAEM